MSIDNGPLTTDHGESMRVEILREAFSEFFVLRLPNGFTEELDPEETRAWFKTHGADMHKIEPVLDEAWNFYQTVAWIDNFKVPVAKHPAFEPQV